MKVGTTVIITDCTMRHHVGTCGVVVEVDRLESRWPYRVQCEDGYAYWANGVEATPLLLELF